MSKNIEGPTDAALSARRELYRFLKRSLLRLETATVGALLLITLAQPAVSRVGLPVWGLVLLFAGYSLLAALLQRRLHSVRSFSLRYVADLPVIALLYFLAGEPGGPLFVLFVLAVDCAAASMTLRGTLLYAAGAVSAFAAVELTLLLGSSGEGDARAMLTRLILLVLVGAGMAIVMRRLRLEQEVARSARDEAGRLEELERVRTEFVSNVSHDLRTPLTAARAALGMLETSANDRLRSDERDLVDNARRNVERLGAQIDDLLAYDELEAGTLRLAREPLDLRDVVLEAVSAVRPLVSEKGQTLEVDLPEPLAAEGDPRRLEQAVVNLLNNAHRHTPPETRIAVRGRTTGQGILLSVIDDGPGIPPEEREAIFGRFHRLSSAEGSFGLGLAIAAAIVELHGGRIWAESRPGEGATFHIALPGRGGDGK